MSHSEGFLPVGVSGKLLNTVVVNQADGTEVHNEVIDQGNVISTNNSRGAANLAATATWTGTGEDVSHYGRVGVSFVCDNAAPLTVFMEVSHDGVSYGGPPRTVADPSTAQPIMWNIVEQYFRIRVVCGATEAQNLSIQTQYSNNADIILAHPLDETLKDEMGATLVRSVAVGQTTGGVYKNVPVDGEGYLKFDVPRSAFGELSIAENVPTFQTDFVYGGPHEELHTETVQAGGAVSYSDGMVVCTSGATDLGLAALSSKRFVKYRAGQGILCRFTALFDATPTVSSIQGCGLSNGENGVLLGYRFSTDFGIWRQKGGLRSIETLTITTGSSTAEDITITLDGNAVTDVSVTNNGSTTDTAWEIAQHDYSTVGDVGWKAYAEGATVVFVCEQTSARAGAFSLSGATTAVGTFAQTVAGAAPTVTAVTQQSFNVDTLDGDGDAANPSGLNIDPTKGNVYQIDIQYLGFGAVRYYVEDPETGRFQLFHIEKNTNTLTTPTMSNPSLVWSLSAYNFTGTSVACKSGSAALYTQGPRVDPIVRYAADAEKLNVSTGLVPILSIKPKQVYGGVLNLGEALIELITVSFEGTKPNRVEIIVDGTLDNDANFVDEGGSSMMMYDTSATTITGGILEFAESTGKSGDAKFGRAELGEFFVNRNKLITIAVRVGANNTDVDAAVTWAEDI